MGIVYDPKSPRPPGEYTAAMAEPETPSMVDRLWGRIKRAVGADGPTADEVLADLRAKTPAPTFWLFGKTQSGKSSIVRYLTGADDAAVGEGFRPCTKATRKFPFPSAELPILNFLDTRGVSDPDYDPHADLAAFDRDAQLMIVTARIADLAQADVVGPLATIRQANPGRPVVLALTCLHELDPTSQHPTAYPAAWCRSVATPTAAPEAATQVETLISHHLTAFAGLVDAVVLIDLTKPEEGYANPQFGGPELKALLIERLPGAFAEAFRQFESANATLADLHWRAARPIIAGYSSAAAAAAAVPVPFLDLITLPAIQMQMCRHLGRLSGKPGGAERFAELAVSAGAGLLVGTAARQLVKLVPVVGSAVAAATAGASTFALGKAYCLYEQKVKAGHLPDDAAIKAMYDEELKTAKATWGN
jgi:uncharacterized protein (DUF697 family)